MLKHSLKNFNKLFYELFRFLRNYKKQICLGSCFFIFGTVIGVSVAAANSSVLDQSHLINQTLLSFLKSESSSGSLFFSAIFTFVSCSLIIICLTKTKHFKWCSVLVLVAFGYMLAFDLCTFVILFGFSGFLSVLFVMLPFDLLCGIVLIFIFSIAYSRGCQTKLYGNNFNCRATGANYKSIFCFLLFIVVILNLLKCFIMPIIKITIIVV